eukprot:CAMPEP_0168328918 /NCGR_PEP_ID=MMETSP0213-20121227/6795_1 /TAXON_ID=151035 /ORGANISM="Euplotes harpa, Strain FSP1.4" /LENGTH=112 /DNA_ID=CAMNT_0008332137 /DNA_START=318 /DNA_END=656 /DNA_ORIENTATION=+
MHFVGVVAGGLVHQAISCCILMKLSAALFLGFGVSTLYSEYTAKAGEKQEEMSELDGLDKPSKITWLRTEIQVFLMIAAEEMGDRSQISAMALSATHDFAMVVFGGFLAHLL